MPASRPSRPTAPDRSTQPSGLTEVQRIRVRKAVRWGLVPVIILQVCILAVLSIPDSSAFASVVKEVTGFRAIKGWGAGNTLSGVSSRINNVRDEVRDVEAVNKEIRDYEKRHSKKVSGAVNSFSVAQVSRTPVESAFNAHRPTVSAGGPLGQPSGHLGYTNQQAVADMTAIMPGATAWGNYHTEYIRSADATLMSLRASVAALQGFDQNMQQDQQRMDQLLSRTRSSDSRLAVGQLQVEGQMELARQIQALRAQQALQTNIYAVTESHRVGSEARSIAKDRKSSCQIMAMLGGGLAGGVVGEVGATVGSNLLCN